MTSNFSGDTAKYIGADTESATVSVARVGD
jgi:hypothetical protein